MKLSEALLSQLEKVRVDEKSTSRKWKSFRQALKSVSTKNGVDALAGKISDCQKELNLHLVFSIKKKADALFIRHNAVISFLNETAQKTTEALSETREMVREELLSHRDHIIHAAMEKGARIHSSPLFALWEEQTIEIEMVQSLYFLLIDDRHQAIPEAHRQTFRWVLQDSQQEDCRWSNFVEWLRTGSGLYWISGKAGSGKSTLMRYIFNDKKTRQDLSHWAGNSSLEIAGFFFWSSGSPIQRSQIGLLRSLLFQALQLRPNLVRRVFPEEWAKNSSSSIPCRTGRDHYFSLSALHAAIKCWIALLPGSSKVCFFIEGLDEYEGDQEEMAEFFKGISSGASNVKLCVSSRPWVVFDEAFMGLPLLRLQDLTFHDIETYVFDKLEGHKRMRLLREAEPDHAAELVNEVVAKASGVFLWVMLVIKSLLDGLRNRDGIDDLRRRLSDLPADLNTFFTHMLNNVEPLYRDDFKITALEMELAIMATPQSMLIDVWEPMNDPEIRSRNERLDVHLKSHCGGLLEIHDFQTRATVQFLHRTVRDFLETKGARTLISTAIISSDFNLDLSIAMAYVTMLKREVFRTQNVIRILQHYSNLDVWTSMTDAMVHARVGEAAGKFGYSTIIDELSRCGYKKWRMNEEPGQYILSNYFLLDPGELWITCDKLRIWQRNFMGLAMRRGLLSYIESKVKEDKSLVLGQHEVPLLHYAVIPERDDPPPLWSHDMVELLLRYGANPNQLWQGNSPWQHLLTYIHRNGCPRSSVIQNHAYIWGEPIHHLHAKSLCSFWAKELLAICTSFGGGCSRRCFETHNHLESLGTSMSPKTPNIVKPVQSSVH
ncbi:hypothetical protein NA56DRAFT_659659 [Hyaloscypha hepaticicola]|uniref:NACHT domain-containing protein n=1 Tax=Hyaloscypha hepaticicola TaxID=2082293 RepID=A0A2J6Q312_9HELO|nr:hypothetical protein NA56DRAFT_659659 [Hyaloscypha hepaticicola]